jgi:hypothetical protein
VRAVKKDWFDLGIGMKETVFGNKVKTYNSERTICDIMRDRNNQDIAIVSESLKRYIKHKDKDINQLMKYAEIFWIGKVLRSYLEVFFEDVNAVKSAYWEFV